MSKMREIIPGNEDRSIQAKFPELSKEWSDKNELSPCQVYACSGAKAWWDCPDCGNHYDSKICNRTRPLNPSGCPECGKLKWKETLDKNTALRPIPEELEGEWPDGVEYVNRSQRVNWTCQCGTEYPQRVYQRIQYLNSSRTRCPSCKKRQSSFGAQYPELLKEWDYEENDPSPFDLRHYEQKIRSWRCGEGHIWKDTIRNRVYKKKTCPVCSDPYLSFSEAREWARNSGIKTSIEWRRALKRGDIPENMPSDPYRFYEEWKSWYDWLGKTKIKNLKKTS